MAKTIKVNKDRCLACGTCLIECALAHCEAGCLVEALSAEQLPQPRLHLEPSDKFGSPMQCKHCKKPRCMEACPEGAISREGDDGPVLIDDDLCIGCKLCMDACPFGVIYLSQDGKSVTKCDLCLALTSAGQPPACVAGCPTGALEWRDRKK